MDYRDYHFSIQERILYIGEGVGIAALVAYIFYRSFIAFILLLPIAVVFFRRKRKDLIRKQRFELTLQFREAIMAVQAALNAGYSVENAFIEAGKDMEKMYGKEGIITREFMVLVRRLRSNVSLEKILLELSERSGVEDIRDFANVFTAAKRSGGDFTRIIKRAAETIRDKIEVKREIETLMSAKKFENKIMEIVPFAIILYIGITSPDFISSLYHNMTGIILMTFCLALYLGAFVLSERIVNIEI